jgi:hypothetical protein
MKRRLNETIEIGDEVFSPRDEYYVTVLDIKGNRVLADGPMGKEYHNLNDLEKKEDYEMGESKGLSEGRKKVIRLTESDLTRLVKRVIKESENYNNNLENLKNKIKEIYDYFENEVEVMVEKDGSLTTEVAEEFMHTLQDYIGGIFDFFKSDIKLLDEDDYFKLEDYAYDTISKFHSFINNHTN